MCKLDVNRDSRSPDVWPAIESRQVEKIFPLEVTISMPDSSAAMVDLIAAGF